MNFLDRNQRAVFSILSRQGGDEEILGECSAHVDINYRVHLKNPAFGLTGGGRHPENLQADYSPFAVRSNMRVEVIDSINSTRLAAACQATTADDFFKNLLSHDLLKIRVKGKFYVALTTDRIILFRKRVPRLLLRIFPGACSFLQIPYYEVESIEASSNEIRMFGSDLNFLLRRIGGTASDIFLSILDEQRSRITTPMFKENWDKNLTPGEAIVYLDFYKIACKRGINLHHVEREMLLSKLDSRLKGAIGSEDEAKQASQNQG